MSEHFTLNIPGIHLDRSPEALHVRAERPLNTLSSGVVGGGFAALRHILNLHVDKDYAGVDPRGDLQAFARRRGIDEDFAGLMTAAWVHNARPFEAEDDGLRVCVLATIGMGNAASAGLTPPAARTPPGTINLIVLVDADLSAAALVNLAITVTEAKCDFLRRLNWRASGGELATGTSTDAVALAATGRGPRLEYAGPATTTGWLAAQLVRRALEAYK